MPEFWWRIISHVVIAVDLLVLDKRVFSARKNISLLLCDAFETAVYFVDYLPVRKLSRIHIFTFFINESLRC